MANLKSTLKYSVHVDQTSQSNWMSLLSKFDDATIYQSWSYGAIRWGEKNLSHLILKQDNECIAIAQCIIKKLPIIVTGIAYIPWGPIWQRIGKEKDPEIFQQILLALQNEYVYKRELLLRIAPNINDNSTDYFKTILKNEGFKFETSLAPRRTFIINLKQSLDELRKNIKRQWRQNLRHAEENNLEIIQGFSDELFLIFYNLYNQMINRKNFTSGIDIIEFKNIQSDLPDSYKMFIMICTYNKTPVAALVSSFLGSTAIAMFAATNEKGLELKAAYLLQWNMIKWLKTNGANLYDLGGINPLKNPGGYQFKHGLSGELGKDVSHIGCFSYGKNLTNKLIINTGEKLLEIQKKVARKKMMFSLKPR